MDYSEQRREPRFPLGAVVKIAVNRGPKWHEIPAFTVNVSHHGLLVTVNEAPELGEHVRVQFPPPDGSWGEAVVRRVVRGSTNHLVGIKLRRPYEGWPESEASADAAEPT